MERGAGELKAKTSAAAITAVAASAADDAIATSTTLTADPSLQVVRQGLRAHPQSHGAVATCATAATAATGIPAIFTHTSGEAAVCLGRRIELAMAASGATLSTTATGAAAHSASAPLSATGTAAATAAAAKSGVSTVPSRLSGLPFQPAGARNCGRLSANAPIPTHTLLRHGRLPRPPRQRQQAGQRAAAEPGPRSQHRRAGRAATRTRGFRHGLPGAQGTVEEAAVNAVHA